MSESDHLDRIRERREALQRRQRDLLGTTTSFVFEIGSGHGHFLTAYAQAHPDQLCVGIDRMQERVLRAERKRQSSRQPNLHFIRADAEDFLAALPSTAQFSAIYILFPDPWPKRRHHKHRLMKEGAHRELSARAATGTRLFFRTDHESYFTETKALVAAAPAWRLSDEPWPFESLTVFQSRQSAFYSFVAIRSEAESNCGLHSPLLIRPEPA